MMKCPRCDNTKTFRHYMLMEIEALIDYGDDGEESERGSGDEDLISGTTMMRCYECDFLCLPEVFGNTGPAGWPKPLGNNHSGWSITQGTEVSLCGVTIKGGRGYLDDKVGESYSQLFQIHICSSPDILPRFIASELPEIRNSALRKLGELTSAQ